MRENYKDTFVRWFTVILVLSILVGGLSFAWPVYLRGQKLRRSEAEMDRRIAAKRAEINTLIENQRRFHTDSDFVEALAHENRRVYPGEYVFIFKD